MRNPEDAGMGRLKEEASDEVRRAEDYYDSRNADSFYSRIWGGNDIHVGIYLDEGEPIVSASERTVRFMLSCLGMPDCRTKVLDIGSGYGGAARAICRARRAWTVDCVNISRVQNLRNERRNAEEDLSDRIRVMHGSFEELPAGDREYDVVWSQDAILHSGDRARVLREVDRVLRPGGRFIFTDPMQGPESREEQLKPVLERIHLSDLASVAFYRRSAETLSWQDLGFVDLSKHLRIHYRRVQEELEAQRALLAEVCDQEYIGRMIVGLGHWVVAASGGGLQWGVLQFSKPQ